MSVKPEEQRPQQTLVRGILVALRQCIGQHNECARDVPYSESSLCLQGNDVFFSQGLGGLVQSLMESVLREG